MNAIPDIYKIKIRYEEFLAHPAMTSLFVVLFFALTFARLPALLYMIMLAVELYIAMFFGARFTSAGEQSPQVAGEAQPSEESS